MFKTSKYAAIRGLEWRVGWRHHSSPPTTGELALMWVTTSKKMIINSWMLVWNVNASVVRVTIMLFYFFWSEKPTSEMECVSCEKELLISTPQWRQNIVGIKITCHRHFSPKSQHWWQSKPLDLVWHIEQLESNSTSESQSRPPSLNGWRTEPSSPAKALQAKWCSFSGQGSRNHRLIKPVQDVVQDTCVL